VAVTRHTYSADRMRGLPRSISPTSALMGVLGLAVMAGCNTPRRPSKTPDQPAPLLSLSCMPQERLLVCRALARSVNDASDTVAPEDVTNVVAWSASDDGTAVVQGGRVRGRGPGLTSVTATMANSDRSISASVLVAVDRADAPPQLAYAIEGFVRDLANTGLSAAQVALIDQHGRADRKSVV